MSKSETLDRLGLIALTDVQERQAQWLVPGLIPAGQISVLGADGGTGKSSLWVDLAAAISQGRACVLDPPGTARPAGKVLFLSGEDSVAVVLKGKLRSAGAAMERIFTVTGEALNALKLGTAEFSALVRQLEPALVVIDPLQSFLPPGVNMASRNEMRQALMSLIPLGEETGAATLIVCHTNKRKAAAGRDRLSDSSDLWDVARSVLMAGYTGNPRERYCSNEKNSYAPQADTVLFRIDPQGLPTRTGTTDKRDRDFVTATALRTNTQGQTRTEMCKTWIMDELEQGGSIRSLALDDLAAATGFSKKVLREAKRSLSRDKLIIPCKKGDAWFIDIPPNEPSAPSTLPLVPQEDNRG